MTAFTGVVAYGFWGLRTRKIPLSLYLMHLRVVSQGLAIGTLSVGMCYMLGKRVYRRLTHEEENNSLENALEKQT